MKFTDETGVIMATRGKTPRAFKWMLAGLLLGALGVLPAPAYAAWTNIFPGVDYSQWTDSTPNRITAVRVNLCAPGVQLRATKSSERRQTPSRSEERRVGKGGRARWRRAH